jgi:hypothetical protein
MSSILTQAHPDRRKASIHNPELGKRRLNLNRNLFRSKAYKQALFWRAKRKSALAPSMLSFRQMLVRWFSTVR